MFAGVGLFELLAYRKGWPFNVKLGGPLLALPLLLIAIRPGGAYAAYLLLVPVIDTVMYATMAMIGIEALLCLRRSGIGKRFAGLLLLPAVLVEAMRYLRRVL
ncbi:hypothetical protein [Paenibacillus sp. UNC496MF]|uniref:hypothetical protein n=1 Tax=Paenibacillus sp. UNC496MF TaxID=1502753 RepID=UPI00210C9B34|nr:hypothetical protein [Paenibacillus sp. UNC496MF]